MGDYTSKQGDHVLIVIDDAGGFGLHGPNSRVSLVSPRGDGRIEVTFCVTGRAFCGKFFTTWRDANEAAKLWAEGFSKHPITGWYPQADDYYTPVEVPGGSAHSINLERLERWRMEFLAEYGGEYVGDE